MTLQELQNKNNYSTDKGTSHTYLDTYEELLRPYKDKDIKLVEVGINAGGSIRLWEDYFTKATIMGVDITSAPMDRVNFKPKTDRVIIHIQDIKEMQSEDFKGFSVAIDDGSHRLEDQLHFVKLMLPVVKGVIIVEDIQRQDYIQKFKELGECDVVDLRHKGHHDNVLIIYRT